MTTLANLADRAQNAISDSGAGTWPQATVEEWATEAIRDYSTTFQRIRTYVAAASTGVRKYDLNTDYVEILSVEYPQSEDPPRYLSRLSYTDPDFWGGPYYDLIRRDDMGTSAEPELWIGESPTTGENIEVMYQAYHDIPSASGTTITPPAHHEHVLVLFCVWKAWIEQASAEIQTPTNSSSLIMSQIAENARQARLDYDMAKRKLEFDYADFVSVIHWDLDEVGQGKIY